MAKVNRSAVLGQTATRNWRMNAVRLAHERGLVGQAQATGTNSYDCASASEPLDHKLTMADGAVTCDCQAGQHFLPCAHAGAVLLLVTGLAPERVRNREGFTDANSQS